MDRPLSEEKARRVPGRGGMLNWPMRKKKWGPPKKQATRARQEGKKGGEIMRASEQGERS